MTVPAYRAGAGPQPDPLPATARAAVDDLFRVHAVDLVRFALMLVGDQSTAEDVVQDAFLGLYRAWDRVRDAYQAVQPQTLRRTAPGIAAGPARRPRRLNALIPVVAAVAVLAVIGASVALPRLLTGAAPKPGTSASALAHEPPFQVIATYVQTGGTSLLVRTPAGHVDSTLTPPRGARWDDVAATANPRKFIVATSPFTRADWRPSRLYTLTLSARGAVTHLTPLAGGSLPVHIDWLAADADGGVIAFSGQRSGGAFVVGAVTGNQVKQWSLSGRGAAIGNVSVTSAGNKIAFITQYYRPGWHFAAMVLATGAAPGSLLARAKTVASYHYPRKTWSCSRRRSARTIPGSMS